jgi:dipeptidase E
MTRLLLLSTSTVFGSGYLEYCADAVREHLGPDVRRVLFVPYALHDRDAYTELVRSRFEALGSDVEGLHRAAGPEAARQLVREAQAIFVGGGNTFRLVNELYAQGLHEVVRERVREGLPYMGSSAGTNVACPTVRTTNDMPICEPPDLNAFDLVPFQINAHYFDPDPGSKHKGETREQRLREYHEMNETPVVGLREGAWLTVRDGAVVLCGENGARLFVRGREPAELSTGTRIDTVLA